MGAVVRSRLALLLTAVVLAAGAGAAPAAADTPTTSAPTTAAPVATTAPAVPTTTVATTTPALPGTTAPALPGGGSTTTTTPGSTTTTTTLGAPNPPDAGALGLEVPNDEATLLALVDEVHARLLDLQSQLANLDGELAQNALALEGATAALATRQDDLYQAERRVDSLEVDEAAARISMRDRAVAAYMHQPTGDLANMMLHLEDPATLVDARSFYHTLVDVQSEAIQTYDRLAKEARSAVKTASEVRDLAVKQEQAVGQQHQTLDTIKQTLETVQSSSRQQASEQATLLAEVGQDASKFTAEIAAQVAESANIEKLLAASGTPGSNPQVPTGGGFLTLPIPGAPITQPFGPNVDPFTGVPGFHPGVDFGAPLGTPIHAAGDGTVAFAGLESGYGNYTCIDHGNGIATCYGHQSVILVKLGDKVTKGQVIGLVGSTGYSNGPHLHFEVRINGQVTDPLPWLIATPKP
jgi:murein DD-endopeptidase MepM/ murein hydrolase activator NlpD